MSRVGLAATSGHGKSWNLQKWLEENLPDLDYAAVMDYKDEFRGLVEGVPPSNPQTDLAGWFIAGPKEVDRPVAWWAELLRREKKLIIAKFRLDDDEWRQVCDRVAAAFRRLFEDDPSAEMLIAFDEAHVVAPQSGSFPENIRKVAKVGRGEGLASLWSTQELQDIDDRISGMWTKQILGGFKTDTALSKLNIDYPETVHNLNIRPSTCPRLPEELRVDGESIPVRQFTEDGGLVGSEWIVSDGSTVERIDTRDVQMASTHYGKQGVSLRSPY